MTTSADSSPTPDELDSAQLAELHAATLKASDSCFELKKLCATVLVPAATLVSALTTKSFGAATFGSATAIVVTFWLADSVGYFYQRKLRNGMAVIWQRRAARCVAPYLHYPRPGPISALGSAFNASMIFYLILAGLIIGGWIAHAFGVV